MTVVTIFRMNVYKIFNIKLTDYVFFLAVAEPTAKHLVLGSTGIHKACIQNFFKRIVNHFFNLNCSFLY